MRKLKSLMAVSCLISLSVISACQPKHSTEISVFEDLINNIVFEELKHSPELKERLGDQINEADYFSNHLLDDRSTAAASQILVTRLDKLQSLLSIRSENLSPSQQTTYYAVKKMLETSTSFSTYAFGETYLTSARPYVINHLDGAYLQLPDFFKNYHTIDSLRDAQEYIERLSHVAGALDDELNQLHNEHKLNITPPKFILEQVAESAQQTRNTPIDENKYVTPLLYGLEYLEDLDLQTGQALLDQAKDIVSNEINPAYERLITSIQEMEHSEDTAVGIGRFEDGNAYYLSALDYYASTQLSPDDIHQIGLDEVEQISAELDLMLHSIEFIEGSVGERLSQMSQNPEHLFEDSDEGRRELVGAVEQYVQGMKGLLFKIVNDAPSTPVNIVRISALQDDNISTDHFQSSAFNTAEAGLYRINQRDIQDRPRWAIPTLSYNETLPGHHLQASIQQKAQLPLIRQLNRFPAFEEGWALYAEDLADELGLYADDPLGRIGYLQSLLLRAASLVVDTGIHSQDWSREQATQYLVDKTGYSYASMQTLVDKYIVWPGHACSDMLGRNAIRSLRLKADRALGNRFDIKEFHSIILTQGARPLSVLENDIENWLNEKLDDQP